MLALAAHAAAAAARTFTRDALGNTDARPAATTRTYLDGLSAAVPWNSLSLSAAGDTGLLKGDLKPILYPDKAKKYYVRK